MPKNVLNEYNFLKFKKLTEFRIIEASREKPLAVEAQLREHKHL